MRRGALSAVLCAALVVVCLACAVAGDAAGAEDTEGFVLDSDVVTCGSMVTLRHHGTRARLLGASGVNLDSGSRHKLVAGHRAGAANEVYFLVQGGRNNLFCPVGSQVRCGDTIRLVHASSQLLLESLNFPAPLSKNFREVTLNPNRHGSVQQDAFWTLECVSPAKVWLRGESVRFQHHTSKLYLSMQNDKTFALRNGPFYEVAARSDRAASTQWSTARGYFFGSSGGQSD